MTTSGQSSSPSSVEADTDRQSTHFGGRTLGILVVLLASGIFVRVAGVSMPSILIAGVLLGWLVAVYRIGMQWRASVADTDGAIDTPLPDDPAERARARYARGELSYKEFESRLEAVSSDDDPTVLEGKNESKSKTADS